MKSERYTVEKNGKTYYPTIGLEVHAELATQTKMFCRCMNDPFAGGANEHTCPTCMAHPGTLPVPNKEAIESVVKVGLALDSEIANFSEFDRKNYFYPDIPKAYQISQFKHPIVSGGNLAGFDITRVHLEEDTATSKHHGKHSLVDFNRAGVPLMELVTEPVLHSPDDVVVFARELQLLLRYLGVSHANMDKGEMRVEVNLSISEDPNTLGTKTEVKNIGSIGAASRAAEYEIDRMIALHEAGKADEIVQETRGWDDVKQQTTHQRMKEGSEDYRYFPDPDLPKMYLHEMFNLDEMKSVLPELPWERRARYTDTYGIKEEDIEGYINDRELAVFFENAIIPFEGDADLIKLASNYITSDIVGMIKNSDQGDEVLKQIDPEMFAKLIKMVHAGDLNSRGGKDILTILATEGGDPETIADEKGMKQQNDMGALTEMAQKIIDANPQSVADFNSGKETAIKYLIGQGMKESKGSANPQILEKLFKDLM